MKAINLGIIGLGYVGQLHLRHGRMLSNARVLAVSDISRKALNRAKGMGAKNAYTNYKELLRKPEIDAVIVALPTHLHLPCVLEAAEAKKDIFLEKPMARNTSEAKEIISAVQRNSVRFMMGYPLRFNADFRKIKDKIDSGQLGDVENAHAIWISSGPFFHRDDGYSPIPVPDWWFKKDLTGGGVLIDIGSHLINLLRWYFGEITDIRSYFGHRFNMDFEDSALCLAKFESGTVGIINVGWFSQESAIKLEIFGSVKNLGAQHVPQNPVSTVMQMLAIGRSRFYQAHFDELQHFVSCLCNDLPPFPTGKDGLKDIEAIDLAYANEVQLK
jgi:predicted dehydrogenase